MININREDKININNIISDMKDNIFAWLDDENDEFWVDVTNGAILTI
jgi:hypothetical protein